MAWHHLEYWVEEQFIDQVIETNTKKIECESWKKMIMSYFFQNPFYSLEMPIRADLFDQNLTVAIDQIERTGFI